MTFLLLYLLSFPLSGCVFYYSKNWEEREQLDAAVVNGVMLELHANPTQYHEGPSKWLPFLRFTERTGPHVFTLRFVDPAHAARRARVHGATVELPDGATHTLRFVCKTKEAVDGWYSFFVNASQFIVDTHTAEIYQLPETFAVSVDVSVDNGESIQRELVPIRMVRKDRVFSGIGCPVD